jgi:hypothetical protein
MDHINKHKMRSQGNASQLQNRASSIDANPYWPKARVIDKVEACVRETSKKVNAKPEEN